MNKYLEVFRVNFYQYFVYRLNFILWRFRVVLNLILVYYLWNSVFTNKAAILGYTKEEMLTYILLISFLSNIVFSSKVQEISGDILNGNIINQLLKPYSFISALLTKEAVDKLVNIGFSLVEMALIIALIQPPISLQTDPMVLGMTFLFLIIGISIGFFISFGISLVAFWSAEIWAPRFIYFILVFVLAGNYFPLDILPTFLYELLLFTPFPYFIYVPAKIYVHGIGPDTLKLFVLGMGWVGLSYVIAQKMWNKGMKEFSFYGR